MKNRVVGASVVNQSTAIWRAGSQFRGCNSTSSLVTMFGVLEMKNRVVGSQCMAILRAGSQHNAIWRAGSQCMAKEAADGLCQHALHHDAVDIPMTLEYRDVRTIYRDSFLRK